MASNPGTGQQPRNEGESQTDINDAETVSNGLVKLGDVIQLPAGFADLTPVSVRWVQNTPGKKKIILASQTCAANYITCYGYVAEPSPQREVLVFIAKEMVDASYSAHSDHLCGVATLGLDTLYTDHDLRIPYQYKRTPTFSISEKWQFGLLGSSQRFLVYHPKSRKPYQHRFTGALYDSPMALNPLVTGAGAPFANEKLNGGMSASAATATIAAINAIPYLLKNLQSGLQLAFTAAYLQDFTKP